MKILFYILVAYLPFQVALNPYPDIDLMSGRVLILALFFYWFWEIRKSFKITVQKFLNLQSISLLAFLFFAVLSLSQAQEIFWGLRKLLLFLSIFPLYFLTVGIIDNFEKVKKVIRILVFSSLPILLIGIFQFFSQFVFIPGQITNFWAKWIAPPFYGRAFGWLVSANPSWLMELGGNFYVRAISLFPDPHTFAIYLGLIIPLAFSLLFFTKPARHSPAPEALAGGENKKLLFIVCCSLLVALLLTFSRGGYFAMLGICIFFALIFIFKPPFKILKKYKILFVVCCLLLVVLFLTPLSPISQCFYSGFDFSRYSNIERVKIWKDAIDSISLHPWFGVGIGNFPKVIDPWAKYLSPINAHSAYLDIASEMGIFTLWVWLILFIGTIVGLLRKIRICTNMSANFYECKVISFGLAGSLIWFSIHAAVETPIYNPTILAILMVIFGLSTTIIQKSKIKNQNDI